MLKILEIIKCDILICVGDIYQIEAIRFGNWFLLAQKIFTKHQIELQNIYRTEDKELQNIWNKVRKFDNAILEFFSKNNISKKIEDFSFEKSEEDEIILCLNYGGLYGVNNINRLLQENNRNEIIYFNGLGYKVGNPILFNEATTRFGDIIHNNLKGIITRINKEEDCTIFTIKVNKKITEENNFKIINTFNDNYTEIAFEIYSLNSDEEDDEYNIVPFQVAYAISIHKAQGLEYNNVSIIIANEIEEQITHNIFYTAITRAKKKLKIYWSPETENKILNALQPKNIEKELEILKQRIKSSCGADERT